MKKIIVSILLLSVFSLSVQSQSYFSDIEYDKTTHQGIALQLPYSTSISEGSILTKLSEIGYTPETKGALFWKKNKINGFYVFKDVVLPKQSNAADLYFKVERKSRRDKNNSVMYLLLSKNDVFLGNGYDTALFRAGKKFLNSFVSETEAYKLNLDIEAQEEKLKDAEKKLNSLYEDEKDLRKKIADLEKDIINKQKDQENQKIEIEKQKAALEVLKQQQKTN